MKNCSLGRSSNLPKFTQLIRSKANIKNEVFISLQHVLFSLNSAAFQGGGRIIFLWIKSGVQIGAEWASGSFLLVSLPLLPSWLTKKMLTFLIFTGLVMKSHTFFLLATVNVPPPHTQEKIRRTGEEWVVGTNWRGNPTCPNLLKHMCPRQE